MNRIQFHINYVLFGSQHSTDTRETTLKISLKLLQKKLRYPFCRGGQIKK